MKRVLIFSVAYHPFVGGAEIAVRQITDRISPEEIEFTMITVNLDRHQLPEEKIGNIMVYRIGKGTIGKFLFPFLAFRKAQKLNKKNTYDAIWSIMASQASIAAAFFKMRNKSKRLILTLQEGDEEEYLQRYVFNIVFLYKIFIRPWYLLVFRKAEEVTVISEYLKKRALDNDVTVPVTVVPNGVDVSLFSKNYNEEELEEVKKYLHKNPENIFLVTTSRLVEKNAVDDIIRALFYLPSNIKLLVIGTGEMMPDLKKDAKDGSFEERIIFLGQAAYEDIPKYLKVSDIFVRPSLSEGFGNAFVEAMAAGVPVIATPVGGIVDFLFDPDKDPDKPATGLFCNPKDPKSIADKVNILLDNPELKEKLIENAKALVREKYDWNLVARQMQMVLNRENNG